MSIGSQLNSHHSVTPQGRAHDVFSDEQFGIFFAAHGHINEQPSRWAALNIAYTNIAWLLTMKQTGLTYSLVCNRCGLQECYRRACSCMGKGHRNIYMQCHVWLACWGPFNLYIHRHVDRAFCSCTTSFTAAVHTLPRMTYTGCTDTLEKSPYYILHIPVYT